MPGFVPNYQDIVLHKFTDTLPALASHVFAICARPPPDAAVQRIKYFAPPSGQVASSLDLVVPGRPSGHPGRQAQPTPRSANDSLDERLSVIVDAVLLVAAKISELAVDEGSHLTHRRVLPFLKFLVATCLVSALDGAVLSDDAWIAVAKLPPAMADIARLAEKYSQIPLLVTLPLQHPELSRVIPGNLDRPVSDQGSNPNASSAITSAESDSDLSKWLANHQLKQPTIQFECDDGPPAPLNEGMHRSIFAAEPPAHLLAVLVVDHRDRIYNSISSALYQRRAWNILTPVVGISFSYESSMVRVLLGWLDGRVKDDGHLPKVHILQAQTSTDSNSAGSVAQGIFCLANPVHVLCLARLLISCKDFFEEDQRKSQVIEQTHDLRWRADQKHQVERTNSRWSFDAVRRWCSGVETQESPFASGSTLSSDRDEHKSGSSTPTEAFRTYTFEQYIGLKETRGLAPPAIGLWLLDRYVGFHSLPPISAHSDPAVQPLLELDCLRPHLAFFETYRRATRFRWPHAWKTSDHLPVVPPFLHTLEYELFGLSQDKAQFIKPHEEYVNAEPLLDAEMSSVLEQCLPTILQVCVLARSLNASSTSQRYRFCYDMLFGISAARNGVRYLSNASLRLSRSAFVDNLIRLPGNTALTYPSSMHSRQGLSQGVEGRMFAGGDEDFRRRIKAAHRRFTMDTVGWKTALKDPLRRSREAPLLGTCDHVMGVGRPPGLLAKGGQCPILTGTPSSNDADFPVPLLPSWTSPETYDHAILTYNILSTVQHNYPTMADSRQVVANYPTDRLSQFSYRGPAFTRIGGHAPTSPELEIPLLIVVHGTQRIRFNVADSSRLRMCLVSSVHFLASLLVFDFPVFGLLTEGTICAVVMAWATRIDGHTEVQIMELNCNAYDISASTGAFNLATFLLWLEFEHAPRLSEALNRTERLASFQNDINSQGFPSGWAMEDQLRDIKQHQDALNNQIKVEEEEDQEDDDSYD